MKAIITYKDKTKATYTTPKKSIFNDKTFVQILKIQDSQIELIEIKKP